MKFNVQNVDGTSGNVGFVEDGKNMKPYAFHVDGSFVNIVVHVGLESGRKDKTWMFKQFFSSLWLLMWLQVLLGH
jgi:hypothetical protein